MTTRSRCLNLNCHVPAFLLLCSDCVRMIVVTVLAELVVAAVWWALR